MGNLGATVSRRQADAVDRIETTGERTSTVKRWSLLGFRLRHLGQLGHLAHGDTNRYVAENGEDVNSVEKMKMSRAGSSRPASDFLSLRRITILLPQAEAVFPSSFRGFQPQPLLWSG